MKKYLYLTSVSHSKILNIVFALLLAAVFSLAAAIPVYGAAIVTPASGGTAIPSSTAGGAYTSLGMITITEGAKGDIGRSQTDKTFILTVPSGFEFNAAQTPSISFTGSSPSTADITAISIAITSTAITVTLTSDDNAGRVDTIYIGETTAIQVRPTAATPLASGNIVRSSSNYGTLTFVGLTSSVNFGTLTEVASATPHTITASAGAGGSISPSGAVTVADADNQSFTITVDPGHVLYDVLVDGVSQGAITSYTFNNVTADHTIAAVFDTITYNILASAGAGGTITPSGSVTVNEGYNQSFTITASSGYTIDDVLVDGVSQGAVSSYTFNNVTAGHTIAATFSSVTYNITATADSGGTITPVGTASVNSGENRTYNIAADPGYFISNVSVDGVAQGAITSYTFNNVTASHTIYATFYTTSVSGSQSGNVPSGQSNHVINASGTAQTIVTVSTSGAVTIEVLQYAGNPHPEAPLPPDVLPRYNDIIVGDMNAVTWPMHVEISYTDGEIAAIDEATLKMYYFQGTSWHLCSSTGVDTAGNFVWADLTQAEAGGSPLIISGSSSGPTSVGGEVHRIDKLQVILPWLAIAAAVTLFLTGGGYLALKRHNIR